jgi:hypothetical protein
MAMVRPNYVPEIAGGGRDRDVGFIWSLWDGGAEETLGERSLVEGRVDGVGGDAAWVTGAGAGDGNRSKRTLGAYVLDLFLVLF